MQKDNFIPEDLLQSILNAIEQSTMGNESEDDFVKLFEDIDLASTKLGRTWRHVILYKSSLHLDAVDFRLDEIESDVLLVMPIRIPIAQSASGVRRQGSFIHPLKFPKIPS